MVNLFKKMKAALRAWKLRMSTQREIDLEDQLKAEKAARKAAEDRRDVLLQDFQALWDDHQELQGKHRDLVFARCQDWKLGRHVEEAERAAQAQPAPEFWNRAARAVGQ